MSDKTVVPAPIDRDALGTPEGREAAFDALCAWVVAELAVADDARAVAVLRGAIGAFYDVREAADAPRGMYEGHFFMVDGVGLDDSDRPVPWHVLRPVVGEARLDRLTELFDEARRDVD